MPPLASFSIAIDTRHLRKQRLNQEAPMKQISSMMAGMVIEILVKPGDAISDGMDVAILESMKMQLPVQADQAGKVKTVKVATGDFVNEGDALLELE